MAPHLTASDWLEKRLEASTEAMADIARDRTGKASTRKALLPYQQRAVMKLSTGTNVLVIEKSRRIGMTWALAAYAVLTAARAKADKGMDAMYISYSQDMTREFVDACAMWAKVFALAAGDMDEFVFADEKEGEETRAIQAFRIRFASGFEIVGLSSAPRTLRGKQGLVIIDEAAFVESLPELLKAALAFLMWGGQVVVCSTHDGADNPFNLLVQDIHAGRSKYAHMRVDFDQALGDGLYQRICRVTGKAWSVEAEAEWRAEIVAFYGDGADEELFCVPSKGTGRWLTTDLIERRMVPAPDRIIRLTWPADYLTWDKAAQEKHLTQSLTQMDAALGTLAAKNRHGLGFDFARVADLSVVDVLAVDPLLARSRALVVELRGVPYDEQLVIVKHIWQALPNPCGGAFDATGAGGFVAEGMARLFGTYDTAKEEGGMIAQIRLSLDWYRQHMPKVKAALEDGRLWLIRDAEHLADLALVKMVKGVATIPDLRVGEKGAKRHGDSAVSLALAWYATLMNAGSIAYTAVAAAGQGSAGDDDWNTPPSARHDFGQRDGWRTPLGHALRGSI